MRYLQDHAMLGGPFVRRNLPGQGDFLVDLVAVPDVTQIWLIGLRAGALLHLSKSVCLQYTRYFLACEALIFEQSFGEVLN